MVNGQKLHRYVCITYPGKKTFFNLTFEGVETLICQTCRMDLEGAELILKNLGDEARIDLYDSDHNQVLTIIRAE